MKVRKAVILAAGYGTRFLPATKSVPKEILPVVDRPVIQFIVEEALAAGLDQIIIVTSAPKRAIEDYFDHEPDLERVLEERGKEEELQEVRRLAEIADMAFVRQKKRLGIGHAVLMARHVVGDEPFALFFPDDVIISRTPAIGQLISVYERHQGSVLAVQKLPLEELTYYGVIEPEPVEERVTRVRRIVEKPPPEEVPSDLGIVGRYVLTPEIWPILARTLPGVNGEIQLTDSLAILIAEGHSLFACQYLGERFDTGRPIGLMKASIAIGLERQDIGPELKEYLRSLDLT